MSRTDNQKPLHGYVQNDTHEHWHETCGAKGLTVSAALQIIGEDLDKVLTRDRVERGLLLAAGRRRRNRSVTSS